MIESVKVTVDMRRLAAELGRLTRAAEQSAEVRQAVAELVDAGVPLAETVKHAPISTPCSVLVLSLAEPYARLLRQAGDAGEALAPAGDR